MSDFSSQFKVGYYLFIADSGPITGPKGLWTIAALRMGEIVVKRKINHPDYNYQIATIAFTTLRETAQHWKVFDRKINTDMVKKLYG